MNEILKIMQVSNSCVNVFIYAGMNSHFRKAVIQFVQGRQVASTFSGVSQRFSTVEKHRRMTIACDDRRNTDSSNTSSNSTILRVELIPSRRASDIWRPCLLMLMKESLDKQWYIAKGIFGPSHREWWILDVLPLYTLIAKSPGKVVLLLVKRKHFHYKHCKSELQSAFRCSQVWSALE